MGARPHCYQRDLNDLCWVKKRHSLPPHKLPLIFHCSANTLLSGDTREGAILFFFMFFYHLLEEMQETKTKEGFRKAVT